jgi:hypothetical protein
MAKLLSRKHVEFSKKRRRDLGTWLAVLDTCFIVRMTIKHTAASVIF